MRILHDPVVLMYHGFAEAAPDHDPFSLVVTRERLAQQLGVLGRGEHVAVDLDGYLDAVARPRRPRRMLVTIDDGYQSVADIAAPMLAAAGVPALLFVPPGRVGTTSAWMDEFADEAIMDAGTLARMPAFGIEIGCHGWDHAVMVGMSDAELRRNTVEAREALADLTGTPPRTFAYPEGRFDQRALDAVRRAGFEVAFSVHDDAGRFAISRVDVNATDNAATFRLKLFPGYRRLWRLADRASVLRRTVRRVAQHI
ncbi:MAG: polysaccharide deacetylase family protein [Acidimicrobiia bacterium]|nr:polysaccharide deacetylase family protein [Acidimicrobiia bacterium]